MFTPGYQCYFMQIAGYLYIANGLDHLARYDGSTVSAYSALSAPTNLSASLVASGLASGTITYYAEVTALNEIGETTGSTEASIAVNKERDNWTSTTDKVTWSWTASSGATRYQLYLADESGDEILLVSTTATSYTDNGELTLNEYVVPPEQNTTGAPKFKSMCISNNRMWATNDIASPYTVYFSGTGQYIGRFSEFYGGGWINLEKGGRETPIAIKHYQTGTGEGRATALCKTPEGKGAVWQLTISTATVSDTSFAIPSATKVVGSSGTESLLGVVATNNDILFPNRKGIYSLGPERNYYGILRTNELSAAIRPYWRSLVSSKIPDICGYFYESKVFFSVPKSSDGNNHIIIYDTERTNWNCYWTLGAKQFLEYTDTGGNTHFLYVPLSGYKLIELSENIANDQGTAFNQSYVSPLIPISKKMTDVFKLQEALVELGRPKGAVTFTVSGIGKNNSMVSIGTKSITSFGSNTGIGTDLLTTVMLSTTNSSVKQVDGTWVEYLVDSPSTYTQSTTKKGIKKVSKLYAIQFQVSSTTADTDFTILKLQAKGRLLPARLPSQWTKT